MYKPSESWSHDFIPCYKKGFEGTTSWRGFWLSLACWATNTTDIIFNTLTELRGFYTQMAQAQRNKKLREGSKLQSSQSQNWSAWKTAIVLPVWRNKHFKPLAETRIEIRRIHLEISHRLHLRRSPSSRATTTVRILATVVKCCEKSILG